MRLDSLGLGGGFEGMAPAGTLAGLSAGVVWPRVATAPTQRSRAGSSGSSRTGQAAPRDEGWRSILLSLDGAGRLRAFSLLMGFPGEAFGGVCIGKTPIEVEALDYTHRENALTSASNDL